MSHDTALDSVRYRLSNSILTGASRCTLRSCSVKLQISTSYQVTPTSHCFHTTVIMYALLNYPAIILHEAVQPLQLTQTRSAYYGLRSCALLLSFFFWTVHYSGV